MEKPRQGLLQALPFSERARIDNEFESSFADVEDALDELKISLRDLRYLFDRTFYGER
jgi:hypothetical protein